METKDRVLCTNSVTQWDSRIMCIFQIVYMQLSNNFKCTQLYKKIWIIYQVQYLPVSATKEVGNNFFCTGSITSSLYALDYLIWSLNKFCTSVCSKKLTVRQLVLWLLFPFHLFLLNHTVICNWSSSQFFKFYFHLQNV